MTEIEQWQQISADAFRGEPPVAAAKLSVLQEKKRHWADVLCTNAKNATSLALANKLVKTWFADCDCDCLKRESSYDDEIE